MAYSLLTTYDTKEETWKLILKREIQAKKKKLNQVMKFYKKAQNDL